MQRPTAFLLGAAIHFADSVDARLDALELTEEPWTLHHVLAATGWPKAERRRLDRSLLEQRPDGDLAAAVPFASLEEIPPASGGSEGAIVRMDRATRIQLSVPERPADSEIFVRLAGVVADPGTGLVQSFVGNQSRWLRRLVRVPVEPSTRRSQEWLWVRLEPGTYRSLPPFRDDAAIRDEVMGPLAAALGVRDLGALSVEVLDGRVRLRGNLRSERQRLLAEWAAARVAGVQAVDVDIVIDPELEVAVAAALAREGLARQRPPRVHARLGCVALAGELPAGGWEHACAVAMSVAGVREVVGPDGATVVSGTDVAPHAERGAAAGAATGSNGGLPTPALAE